MKKQKDQNILDCLFKNTKKLEKSENLNCKNDSIPNTLTTSDNLNTNTKIECLVNNQNQNDKNEEKVKIRKEISINQYSEIRDIVKIGKINNEDEELTKQIKEKPEKQERELTKQEIFELKLRKYNEEQEKTENELMKKKKDIENEKNLKKAEILKDNSLLWSLKYKPITSNEIYGNSSNITKLKDWLINWNSKHLNYKYTLDFNENNENQDDDENENDDFYKYNSLEEEKKPNKSQGKDGKIYSQSNKESYTKQSNFENIDSKSLLISGPPGIGKTTTVKVVCEELDYQVYELNASDNRNAGTINSKAAYLSRNTTINKELFKKTDVSIENYKSNYRNISKNVIIMDEVDGMGGNEDKGGIRALTNIIKTSKIPIICICNERSDMKLKSLINISYELKFQKQDMQNILKLLNKIKNNENLSISDNELERIAEECQGDIRQSVNLIENWYLKYKSNVLNSSCKEKDYSLVHMRKDLSSSLNPYEAVNKLITNINDNRKMTNEEKLSIFFIDTDFIPLLIQENYLYTIGNSGNNQANDLERIINTSDSLSEMDILDNKIKKESQWSLLYDKGIYTSIIIPNYINNYNTANTSFSSNRYCKFPRHISLLSKITKRKRLLFELKKASKNRNDYDIIHEYCPFIMNWLINKLSSKGKEAVEECINFLIVNKLDMVLLKENVYDLCIDSIKKRFDFLPSSIKYAFTKGYNDKYKVLKRKLKGIGKGKGKEIVSSNFQMEVDDDETDSLVERKSITE